MKRFFTFVVTVGAGVLLTACTCERCRDFEQFVYSFENQIRQARTPEAQRELMPLLYNDPLLSCHYLIGVKTLKKDTAAGRYLVEMTFRCCCAERTCLSGNKSEISMTVEILGNDNYYALFRE